MFQNFLKDLLREAKRESIDEDKLIEYTDTLLNIFDSNKDGKLQLSEMAKLVRSHPTCSMLSAPCSAHPSPQSWNWSVLFPRSLTSIGLKVLDINLNAKQCFADMHHSLDISIY